MRHASSRSYLRTILCAAVLSGVTSLGCDDSDRRTDTTTAPTVGERVDRGLNQTGETLDRAADRAGDVIGPAVDDAIDRTRQAGQQIRAGAQELAADVAGGVHHVLAEITESAMTRGGIDPLVERLAESDQQRIGRAGDQAFPQLDTLTERFRETWRSRYGRDFDIDDPRAVLNFITIEGADDAQRTTAIFPARGGMSELRVPMVREGNAWRVDVPETVTAQQIADNLASGLRPIVAGEQPLPDDIVEAYRRSAHGTLAAVMGEQRGSPASPTPSAMQGGSEGR